MTVRILEENLGRNTVYLDESGIPSVRNLENQSYKKFILTGIVANNDSFEKLESYYDRLKLKYFGKKISLHTAEIVKIKTKKTENYLFELSNFLESIEFFPITVILDKERMLNEALCKKISNPFSLNLHIAKALWKKSELRDSDFRTLTVDQILFLLSRYEIRDLKPLSPLFTTYRKIIEVYLMYYNSLVEICFESSTQRSRLLRFTDIILQEDEVFANLKNLIYSNSFPNKKSNFMGLEIADMYSYIYYLIDTGQCHLFGQVEPLIVGIKQRQEEYSRIGKKTFFNIKKEEMNQSPPA